MNVKLIGLTQSFVEGIKTPEELLIYIARVSTPSNQMNTETSDKLIKYLIAHEHWSPFDMVNMIVEVKTSKAVSIQILRHWSIKPQEFSQRYSSVTDIENIEFRKQANTNRQSSTDILGSIDEWQDPKYNTSDPDIRAWIAQVSQSLFRTLSLYAEGINLGIAKETARMILPMATSTTMYLNGSVRSWIHYLHQRLSEHAQKEHRIIAAQIADIFKQNFPFTAKAINL